MCEGVCGCVWGGCKGRVCVGVCVEDVRGGCKGRMCGGCEEGRV